MPFHHFRSEKRTAAEMRHAIVSGIGMIEVENSVCVLALERALLSFESAGSKESSLKYSKRFFTDQAERMVSISLALRARGRAVVHYI